MDTSLAKEVVDSRRITRVTDISGQAVSPDFKSMWVAEAFQTYIGAPIIVKNEVVGVLEVFLRSEFIPDDEWIDYFETLTGQAAIAH